MNSVFFRSTLKHQFFILKLFLSVLWTIVIFVLICIVQFLPDEVVWKKVCTLFFQSSQNLVAAWVVSLTQSHRPRTFWVPHIQIFILHIPRLQLWARLTHDHMGRLLDTCSWNGCPKPEHLQGASGREVLVLCIADVGSKAINPAINLLWWTRPKSYLLWGD